MTRRSKKEYLWLLAILVVVSTMVTLHLGHRLLWLTEGVAGHFASVPVMNRDSNSEPLPILRNIKRMANDSSNDTVDNISLNDSIPFNNNNNHHHGDDNGFDSTSSSNSTRRKDETQNTNIVYKDDRKILATKKIIISTNTPTKSTVNKDTTDYYIKGEGHVGHSSNYQNSNHNNDNKYNNSNNKNHSKVNDEVGWTSKTRPGQFPFMSSAPRRTSNADVRATKGGSPYHKHKLFTRTRLTGRKNKREHIERMEDMVLLLQQIENATLTPSDIAHPTVVVKGSLTSVKQHFPLMESAFHKYKMTTIFNVVEGLDGSAKDNGGSKLEVDTSWSVLICLNTTDGVSSNGCVVSARHARIKEYQKINVIPGMSKTPSESCYKDHKSPKSPKSTDEGVGNWYGGDFQCMQYRSSSLSSSSSPPSSSLNTTTTDCESVGGWWLSETSNGKPANRFVPCDMRMQEKTSSSTTIVVPLPHDLLTLKDSKEPLVWQVYTLVTSMSPLRAYLHPSGVIWEGLEAYIHKKLPRKVSLLDLQQLISDLRNEDQAMTSIFLLEDVIRNTLMHIERQTMMKNEDKSFSTRFFQLFEVVVVFNSTFHPHIIQVNPTSYVDGLSSLSKYLVEQNILEDLAAMLSSRSSVVQDIAKTLTEFGLVKVEDYICTIEKDYCMDRSDLTYILDTRREHAASRNWRRLCPSTSKPCSLGAFSPVLDFPDVTENDGNISSQHLSGTSNFSLMGLPKREIFHSLILAVEVAFLDFKVDDFGINDYNESNIPLEMDQPRKGIYDLEPPSISNISYIPLSRMCDNNSDNMSHLSAIHTHPHLILQPEFSPLTTDYYTHVSHDTLLISIKAFAKNCKAIAILEDRPVTKGWVNFTLGIGENVAHIVVVESGHPYSHWGLNTYKIKINRKSQDQHLGVFDAQKNKHQVCALKQDCSLPYSSTDPCGIHHLKQHINWKNFIQRKNLLRPCESLENGGQWVVPCTSCHDSNSCYWRNASWGSEFCQEKKQSEQSLQTCFKDKKVLFLGDSTIRGISHYLMERINGTLQDWDKTHNIKVYPYLNGGHTMVGFAYYPQFWLPVHKRPLFDVALKKLLQRAAPLSNSSNTVLALGGVHWLAWHHIDLLQRCLLSEGLTGINVVVKGLGAGFHQPISSMHHLTHKDHEKLLSQNLAVLTYARTKGFQVVDTFNMTMSRYSEFLQGKCACHFQRVIKQKVSIWNKLSRIPPSPDIQPTFHVEGDIGAAYSEMMINRICNSR